MCDSRIVIDSSCLPCEHSAAHLVFPAHCQDDDDNVDMGKLLPKCHIEHSYGLQKVAFDKKTEFVK